jgi:hypothetical protein
MEFKLGKLPARIDKRTIPLSKILRVELLPELPSSFDVDESVGGIQDNFIFNNSIYGDCVIAARAHQTLRFEKFEQGNQIAISDKEVTDEYFKETGGPDNGLVLLYSLKDWRNDGWIIGGKKYTIYAFASVDWMNHDEVKHCIHLLGGVNFGMYVYQTDIDQFNQNLDWELTGNNGSFLGGHGVYGCAYIYQQNTCPHCAVGWTEDGLICITWGRRQKMTWDFWDARVDEAYGIVDNRDSWLGDSPVDINKLDGYLKEITGNEEEPSTCFFSNGICKIFNGSAKILGRKTRLKAVI